MPDAVAATGKLEKRLQNKQKINGEGAEIKTELNEVLISQLPSDVQTAAGTHRLANAHSHTHNCKHPHTPQKRGNNLIYR